MKSEQLCPGVPSREPSKEGPISSEMIAQYIAAGCNSEARALLLALMEPGKMYTRGVYKLLIDAQGPRPAWEISERTVWDACRGPLTKTGILSLQKIDTPRRRDVWVVGKTAGAGVMTTALDGHLLAYSLDRPEMSLRRLCGDSQSPGKPLSVEDDIECRRRSALVRLTLFRYFAGSQAVVFDLMDISRATGTDARLLSSHVADLAECGLLRHDSREGNVATTAYSLRPDGPRPNLYPSPKFELTGAVFDVLARASGGRMTIEDIVMDVFGSRQQCTEENMSRVRSILRRMYERGIVDKQERDMAVYVDRSQKAEMAHVSGIIGAIQLRDPRAIALGLGKAQAIVSDPKAVNRLMEKARAASSNVDSIPSHTLEETIFRIVCEYQGGTGITSRQMRASLGTQGVVLDDQRIKDVLRQLRACGRVRSQGSVNMTWHAM